MIHNKKIKINIYMFSLVYNFDGLPAEIYNNNK